MFGVLVVLFTVIPAIEIYLLFSLGSAIGGMNTLIVVITTGIVGAALAKSQGIAILNKLQTDLSQGQLPANQLIHGFLVFAGGLLLLTPGFMTDILGLSMVFPGTRHLYVSFLKNKVERGLANGTIKMSGFSSGGGFSGFSGGFSSSSDFKTPDFEQQLRSKYEQESSQQVNDNADTFEADYKKKE